MLNPRYVFNRFIRKKCIYRIKTKLNEFEYVDKNYDSKRTELNDIRIKNLHCAIEEIKG